MPVREGDILDDRFELGRAVASGGMGMVFRARDRQTGALVAVKTLRGVDGAERFRREMQVLSSLRHPGIVTYLGHGRSADELYLVMEWLEGEDLGARLAGAEVTVDEAVGVGVQIASALAAAHAQGIVHRDIKPSNVFLADWRLDRVKLLDCGIARNSGASTLTEVGMVVGTPAYMAPEQARGEPEIDARADVYALGALLFHCLTGRPPFEADAREVLLAAVVQRPVPRVGELVQVPRALEDLVGRMLEKDPRRRPSDGREAWTELTAIGLHLGPLALGHRAGEQHPGAGAGTGHRATRGPLLGRGAAVPRYERRARPGLPLRGHRRGADQHPHRAAGAPGGGTQQRVRPPLDGRRCPERRPAARGGRGARRGSPQGGRPAPDHRAAGGRRRRIAAVGPPVRGDAGPGLRDPGSDRHQRRHRAPGDAEPGGAGGAAAARGAGRGLRAFPAGRQLLHNQTSASFGHAEREFQRAIEIDPGYAPAFAGLAQVYMWHVEWLGRGAGATDAADRASRRALELGPELAESHVARGAFLTSVHDYAGAEQEYLEALRLNPRSFEAHYLYARTCVHAAKFERAVELFRGAAEVRPEDFQSLAIAEVPLLALGRLEEAAEARRESLRRIERHLELDPRDPRALILGAIGLVTDGQRDRAFQWAARALEIAPEDPATLINAGCMYVRAGMKEEALACLEKSFGRGFGKRDWVNNDPDYAPLRSDPRFQALVEKLA